MMARQRGHRDGQDDTRTTDSPEHKTETGLQPLEAQSRSILVQVTF